MDDELKVQHVDCDCVGACTVMRIQVIADGSEFFVSLYRQARNKFPLTHKLRMIGNILRYGEPYEDQIILNAQEAQKVEDFINKNKTML